MDNDTNQSQLLTQHEVEVRCRASASAIWKWTKKGRFPKPIKPGGPLGRKYYRLEDIEAYERGEYQDANG